MKLRNIFAFLLLLVVGLQSVKAQEAYACYTSEDMTLTFYYDNLRSSRSGSTYDLKSGDWVPDWYHALRNPVTNNVENVTKVVFDSSFSDARPTSTTDWFYNMTELQTIIGFEYLNTSEVLYMREMFCGCDALTSIDVSNFNTANVTDMCSMFCYCKELTSLDLSNFNTANVTDMSNMFFRCEKLTSLDLSHFNTANVIDMGFMFYNCDRLDSPDVSNFNTANVTSMCGMFSGCNFFSLDLSSFNTAKVTNMSYMFQDCFVLETIYVGDGWSTAAVTESNQMFYRCYGLVGGQGTTYEATQGGLSYAHIDGGTSNPGYFSELPEAYACYSSENKTLTFYCDNLRSSRSGSTYDMNTGSYAPDWYFVLSDSETNKIENVTTVVFDSSFTDARPTSTSNWFFKMIKLQTIIGLEYLNTSEVTNMDWMFSYCEELTNLDLSHFNTANVKDMSYMFADCTNMQTLDLSHFNTANVTNMLGMFRGCHVLSSLDLSSFNTARVGDMSYMFTNCYNLETIYVGDNWSTAAVVNSVKMFTDCNHLVGGQGTTYDANHTDASYAHVDGSTSNPGYLTSKTIDLWIAGIKVTYDNLDDLTGLVAELDDEAMERYLAGEMEVTYNVSTKTLTLKNAIIKAEESYGLHSKMPQLNIKLEGQNTIAVTDKSSVFFQKGSSNGTVTFLGDGSLDVTSDYTPIISQLDVVIKDGAMIKLESTGDETGINGLSNGTRLPILTLRGTGTELRTKGGSAGSLTDFSGLNLGAGIEILEPTGATFSPNLGIVKDGVLVANEWVVIAEPVTSFMVDGIYYNVIGDKIVNVTYTEGYNTYSGNVDIPETVTYRNVTYTVTQIDNLAFFDCPNLTSVTMPETVTVIGNRAFKGCTSLTSIIVPDKVTSVGVNAFENCTALKVVTLGGSLQTVGVQAFHNCPALTTIVCYALNPPTLQSNTFDDEHYDNVNVYVDLDYVLDYIYAPIWEKFYVDTIDAINEIDEKKADAPWFDLQGRKVSKPQKGIYIKGGKKFLVK